MMWMYFLEALLMGGAIYIILKNSKSIHANMVAIQTSAHNNAKVAFFGRLKPLLRADGMGKHQSEAWWKTNWHQFVILLLVSIPLALLAKSFWIGLIPCVFVAYRFYSLIRKVRLRKERILKRIPFVLDMLILNLQSGLDFVSSLEELVGMNDPHPLHDEIRITLQSIHVGESRSQAFQNLGLRTQVPELANLASVIQQSETMGSSLIELLQMQSHEIRHRIFKQAEGEAQKAPVKILIPMLAFIFPVVFIILFVPIGLQLMNNFK